MLSKILIYFITFYQRYLSPDQGLLKYLFITKSGYCNMYPSCSNYMIMAIQKYGAFFGLLKGINRITRCHPYQKKLVDFP